MPTYEYRCRTCEHRFEIQQTISDDPLTECPECAGDLRKVFHPVGIAFKGEGFYRNDARSEGGGKSRSSSNGSSTSTDGSSHTGSDSSSNGGSPKDGSSTATKPADSASGSRGETSPKPAASTASTD